MGFYFGTFVFYFALANVPEFSSLRPQHTSCIEGPGWRKLLTLLANIRLTLCSVHRENCHNTTIRY